MSLREHVYVHGKKVENEELSLALWIITLVPMTAYVQLLHGGGNVFIAIVEAE